MLEASNRSKPATACNSSKQAQKSAVSQATGTYYVHCISNLVFIHTILYLQLYERRSKVTHSGEEKERFAVLSLDYMSEESSSDGGETMFVHQPPWRSNSKPFQSIVCSLLSISELLLHSIEWISKGT